VSEFQDVMEIAQRPPRVALLKLRMALTDKAKLYGVGRSIEEIFASLRARFGISAVDAQARLKRLRRDTRTPLQEHAATVMRLTQISFHDLPPANRERYTYDAFVQSINDWGLHRQFLARGVTTVEEALPVGEAYLLASSMHQNRVAFRHVDTEPSAAPSASSADDPVVANVGQGTVASKVAETTSLLTQLLSMLAPLCQADNTREFNEPRVPSPGERHLVCWGCGKTGHFRRNCPHFYPELNYDGPRMLPHPTGRH